MPPPAAPAPPANPPSASPPPAPPGDTDPLYGSGPEIEDLDGAPQPPQPEAPKPPKDNKPPETPAKPPDDEPPSDFRAEIDKEIEGLDVIENPDADPNKPKPEAPPKPPERKPEDTPAKARDLKVVYEQVKAEKKTLETKLAEVTTQLEQARKANPDEVKALSERLETSEKVRKELESELRFLNYAKHPEFKEKFDQPYVKAWEAAMADISELTITNPATQETRQAKQEDMVELANMPYGLAARKAEELFGPVAAAQILMHRQNIITLSRSREKALEDSRKEAGEREKTMEAESRARNEKLSGLWKSELEGFASRFPKWTRPVDGDDEGNALLEKGYADVDRFFKDTQLSPEDRVKLHVKLRAKAANHDRLALRLKRAAEKIKKLKEDLAGYERAEPPGGKTGRTGIKPPANIFEAADREIEALDEK